MQEIEMIPKYKQMPLETKAFLTLVFPGKINRRKQIIRITQHIQVWGFSISVGHS